MMMINLLSTGPAEGMHSDSLATLLTGFELCRVYNCHPKRTLLLEADIPS